MASILILEKDPLFGEKIARVLGKAGHYASVVTDADQASDLLLSRRPGLILFNASLPWASFKDFLSTLSMLRQPVLFLTTDALARAHLQALYHGPSAVLVRPLSAKQLLLQVNLMLAGASRAEDTGRLLLDENRQTALVSGEEIPLTGQEYALLKALLENANMPVSREVLLRNAWGYQSMGETRTVDVHVQRLRKKLGESWIETIYKLGYRLKTA